MAKPTTIEVTALKPFALGGSEFLPGKVKVPSSSVEKLAAKGFIEAPEPSGEQQVEASSGLVSQGEVEALQKEINSLQGQFAGAESTVVGLQGDLKEANELLEAANDKVKAQADQIEKLKKDLEAAKKKAAG